MPVVNLPNGDRINFPEGTPETEMNTAIEGLLANQEQPVTDVTQPPQQEPTPVSNMAVMGESLTREVPSNILGAPMDLVNLLANTVKSGAQVLSGGGDEPYQAIPAVGGSEFFKENVFSEVADRGDYTGKQRLLGNVTTLGSEALTGGTALASKAKQAQNAPEIIKDMVDPYINRPKSQVATDVAGGVGAGGGLTAAEETDQGPIATLFATLMGGMGGSGTARTVENTGRGIHARRESTLPDGTKFRNDAIDDASTVANELVTDKQRALTNIDQSLKDADELGIPDPTTGPASGDIGLSMIEVKERLKNPQKFVEQDQKIRTGVAGKFAEYQNPDADVTAPQRASTELIDKEIGSRQQQIDDLSTQRDISDQKLTDLERQGDDISAPVKARRGDEGRALTTIDKEIGKEGLLGEMTDVKNQAFEDASEGALMDAKELLKTVEDVDAELSTLADPNDKLPSWIADNIKKMIPEDGTLEQPGSTAGMIPADDVLKLRMTLGKKASEARNQGKYTQAEQLDKLRSRINSTIENDPRFKEANKAYKEDYAPIFAEGEGKTFRDKTFKGDGTGSADPEKLVKSLIDGTGSAKQHLNKLREALPDSKAFDDAEELYFDAKLAKKDLNPAVVRNFVADNKDILPDNLKTKYEGIVKELMDNQGNVDKTKQISKDLKKKITLSERELSSTKRSLESGPFGKMSGQDQDKYIESIMSGKDRNKQVDTVLDQFKGDKEATDGFKEATVRWLQKKVKGTDASATDLPDTDNIGRPVVYSKLTKTFDENREVLSKVFSPQEMNDLNRIHKLMSKQNNLSRRATTGSDTVEKLQSHDEQLYNVVEAALRIKYGVLKTGGIMATFKKLKKSTVGESGRVLRAEEVLNRMAFDPKVAKHLLEIKPMTINNGKWFTDMNKIIGAQEAISTASEEDE